MIHSRRHAASVALLLCAVVSSMGCATVKDGPDTGADTISDTGVDTWLDSWEDTGIDSGVDTGIDTRVDTGVDSGIDTAVDTAVDIAVDSSVDTAVDPGTDPSDACLAAIASFDYDFEGSGGCAGWSHAAWTGSGCGGYDSWQCGIVGGWPGNPSGSSASWGTDLSSGGFPANLECSFAASPALDLTPCAGRAVYLDFRAAYSIEDDSSRCRDGGFVQVNDSSTAGAGWVTIDPGYDGICDGCHHLAGERAWCGYDVDWQDVRFDVSAYTGRAAFQVRFLIEYDSGYPWSGLFVDDVRLSL